MDLKWSKSFLSRLFIIKYFDFMWTSGSENMHANMSTQSKKNYADSS